MRIWYGTLCSSTVLENTCREAGGEKGGRSPSCSGLDAGVCAGGGGKRKEKKSGWVSVQILQEKSAGICFFR